MQPIRRGYVTASGRRVHFRYAGSGEPLVMLHGSPGDSEMLEPEIAAAAERFACIALDTPGFGESDPLPGETLVLADLAKATAEAMDALGLPPCRVYGTHTGAAIAVELGAGWPERVSGLVIEGLPIFTEAEIATLFEGYFEPMATDPLGAHLTRTWVRFRDQFTWFPWTSRNVTRLNLVDRPTPDEIDPWVSMFYRSCKTYGPAYKAACTYGQGAFRAAAALTRPAVFMASAEDMLFPHLDRLPPLRADQSIARLPYDHAAKMAAIVEFASALPGGGFGPAPGALALVGHDPAKAFVDTPDGQILVRTYGERSNPAVVLLHDGPGSGLALDELARALAASAYVILPDLPGVGQSSAPAADRPIIAAAADAIQAVATALTLERYVVAAIGSGGAVGAALAERDDARLVALLLESPPSLDERTAEAIAPDLPLSPEGAHWLKAWLMLRDGQIYRPWFDGRVAAQRKRQGNFDADWLHEQTKALMASRASYHRLPRAAYRFDTTRALANAKVPVSLAAEYGLAELVLSRLTREKELS
jgi:pimeloyl-ACP methyl ester carboxylesterase